MNHDGKHRNLAPVPWLPGSCAQVRLDEARADAGAGVLGDTAVKVQPVGGGERSALRDAPLPLDLPRVEDYSAGTCVEH